MNKKFMIFFAFLLAGLASACGLGSGGATQTQNETFFVGDSPKVIVSGDNGRVVVISGPDRTVSVKATLRKPDKIDYEIIQTGDEIKIIAESHGGGIFNFGHSPAADIEITTPDNSWVELQTSDGSVEVYGIQQSEASHTSTVRTSNGKIVLEKVAGDFEIVTSNGGVSITQAIGSFDVKTSNGPITFDGELSSGGSNKMTTSNGNVEIRLQGTPSVKLDGSTNNGSIDTEHPILTSSPGDKHHLVGTIGNGEAELLVRSSNGSIKIR